MILQKAHVRTAAILHALIGVVNEAFGGFSLLSKGLLQRFAWPLQGQPIRKVVADNLSRIGVHKDRGVAKTLRRFDVGQIRDPDFACLLRDAVADQIFVDAKPMLRIGRADGPIGRFDQQVLLPKQVEELVPAVSELAKALFVHPMQLARADARVVLPFGTDDLEDLLGPPSALLAPLSVLVAMSRLLSGKTWRVIPCAWQIASTV